jgi:hypothetical protein
LEPYGKFPNNHPDIGDIAIYQFGSSTDISNAHMKHLYIDGIDNNVPNYHLQLGNPYAVKS